jgi:hypothetical protein
MSRLEIVSYRKHSGIRMLVEAVVSLGLFLAGLGALAQNLVD